MHFSVHTSLGKFVLTICNYLLLLLLCGVVHMLFIIINSKLRLVSANWKPSGKGNSSEIPPDTWTLSESRSCLFLKQALASKCILNALWCGNSHEIPDRSQTLSESESACLRYVLIIDYGTLAAFSRSFLCLYQGVSILAIKQMVYLTGINWCFDSNLG